MVMMMQDIEQLIKKIPKQVRTYFSKEFELPKQTIDKRLREVIADGNFISVRGTENEAHLICVPDLRTDDINIQSRTEEKVVNGEPDPGVRCVLVAGEDWSGPDWLYAKPGTILGLFHATSTGVRTTAKNSSYQPWENLIRGECPSLTVDGEQTLCTKPE